MYTFTDIKKILVERDGCSASEAQSVIACARAAFRRYLACGDIVSAMDVCEEYFNLEPDYMSAFGV